MSSAVIIGGGPAGLSAAVYLARAGIGITVLYRDGGALEKTEKIENYFGFPEPISGTELLKRGQMQAKRLGASLVNTEVTGVEYAASGFSVKTTSGEFSADGLIIAAGAPRKVPDIPGIHDLEGRGVSYCAVCDAFFYRGKRVSVLGEGEYAVEEARILLSAASEVMLLTNGKEPPAKLPEGLAVDMRKIESVEGSDKIERIIFKTGEQFSVDGLFIAFGTAGSSDLARKLGVFTEAGQIKTDNNMMTNVPGVFAAGDCTGGLLQISKSVSDGAQAALNLVKFLKEKR